MLAMAEVRAGRLDEALATLSRLARAFPCNSEYLFWRGAVGWISGRFDRGRLDEEIAALEARLDDPAAPRYAALLRGLGAARPGQVTQAELMVESTFGLKR
jgi:tetratricopeptide (TPR) repeat protein